MLICLGGSNSPTHAGLPRIPGIPLLPGGIPRNANGQIDVVKLIGELLTWDYQIVLVERREVSDFHSCADDFGMGIAAD